MWLNQWAERTTDVVDIFNRYFVIPLSRQSPSVLLLRHGSGKFRSPRVEAAEATAASWRESKPGMSVLQGKEAQGEAESRSTYQV